MSISWTRPLSGITLLGLLLIAVVPAIAQTGQPDSTLYTNYFLDTAHTSLNWVVCGRTLLSSGCYGAGKLGPFGKVGAILEGNQFANLSTSTVGRFIYILDVASGTTLDGVTLYVYRKTDVVSPSSDTVTVTLSKTVSLPLVGGSTALASMAANNNFIFMGTNQSPNAVRLQKSNFAIAQSGGFSPPLNVAAITANKYGYITVTFGNFETDNANIVFGPDGNTRGDGGGAGFMLSTDQAVLPSTLP